MLKYTLTKLLIFLEKGSYQLPKNNDIILCDIIIIDDAIL